MHTHTSMHTHFTYTHTQTHTHTQACTHTSQMHTHTHTLTPLNDALSLRENNTEKIPWRQRISKQIQVLLFEFLYKKKKINTLYILNLDFYSFYLILPITSFTTLMYVNCYACLQPHKEKLMPTLMTYQNGQQFLQVLLYDALIFMQRPAPLLRVIFAGCQLRKDDIQSLSIVTCHVFV